MVDATGASIAAISRRGLVVGAGATAAAAMLGSNARAAGPQRGGHLVISTGGSATGLSLDPRTLRTAFAYLMGRTIYNYMVSTQGLSGELVPELAESWVSVNGARSWVFKMRRDVIFHNGKPCTAEDAAWSINLHLGPAARSSVTAALASVQSVRATDRYEVTVDLKEPDVEFPYLLSLPQLGIIPAETTAFDGLGTGPYKVTRYRSGEALIGARHEGYWKSGVAHADTVELLAINDAPTRLSALQAGKVHAIANVSKRAATLLAKTNNLKVMSFPSSGQRVFAIMMDVAPYDNADLRMALKLAIDRQEIVSRGYAGMADLANDHPVAESNPYYAADIPRLAYDPDRARSLYQKSGHSGPLVLTTSEAAGPEAIEVATLYREHAAKAGINLVITRAPSDNYFTNVWLKNPFCANAWTPRPNTDSLLTALFASHSSTNETHMKHAELDDLIVKARREESVDNRKQIYRRCQEIISLEGSMLNPAFPHNTDAISNRVGGYEAGAGQLCDYRAAEVLWLNS